MALDYYGLPTHSISNPCLQLDFLAEAGPRIVRLMLSGSNKNIFAEVPDLKWPTPYGDYYPRGGHRLWHAPEAPIRSDIPDDDGLTSEPLPDGVRLCAPREEATGLRKRVDIHLVDHVPQVIVRHHLQNASNTPMELAPWAITMVPLGGLAVIPQRGGSNELLPDRHIAAWPYTRWHDDRLHLRDDYLIIDAQARADAFKVGCLSPGWIGYLRDGAFLVKRFDPQLDQLHPDRNCNAEVYGNHRFIELETLAPLVRLEAGQSVEHVETWEMIAPVDVPTSMAGALDLLKQLRW